MCLPTNVKGRTIQSIAVAIGNLLCLNFGMMFGITPAHMALYQTAETPLNAMTDAHGAAWLMGFLFLSAAVGALWSGWLARKIGPKSVLLMSGLLQITAWFCIHFAYALIHIYSSRLFTGFASGAAFVVLPIFINEIAESHEKAARLIFTIDIWRALGVLIGIILGYYEHYEHVSIVGCSVSFVFTMCFPFVQESPYYFQRRGNVASMEKALRWYRGIRDIDSRNEPAYLREINEFHQRMQGKVCSIGVAPMPRAYVWRLALITLLLTFGGQLLGVYILMSYVADFLTIDNPATIQKSVIILATAQLLGALMARWLGPRMPRKLLLSISSLFAILSAIALSVCQQQSVYWQLDPNVAAYLPLLLLASFVLFVHFGLSPLTSVVSSELLPEKLHNYIFAVISALSWTLIFLLVEFFDVIENVFGISTILWCSAGICFVLTVLLLVLLPETLGRNCGQLQQQLGYVSNGGIAKITEVSNGQITHI